MSGGNNERPELHAAIKLCRKTNASLVVAKVDRLSRDVEFVAKLLKDKNLKIRVANIPNADNFTLFKDEQTMINYMAEFAGEYSNTASHLLHGKKYWFAWTHNKRK